MKFIGHEAGPSPEAGPLSQIGLFRGLEDGQLARIAGHLQPRVLSSGAVFIHQGQSAGGLFFLREGSVKVFLPVAGEAGGHSREVIIAVCGAGETLGEIDLADGNGHTASVATFGICRLWWLESEDFWRCHDTIPQLGRNLCRLLARRIRWSTAAQDALMTLHLPGKIAYYLLLLARDQGTRQSNGDVLLPLHLRQGEIASMAGSSRECVNRILADFKKRRWIRSAPGERLLIRDEAALSVMCEGLMPTVKSEE
jgi:CRP-like cAMP-binding protein